MRVEARERRDESRKLREGVVEYEEGRDEGYVSWTGSPFVSQYIPHLLIPPLHLTTLLQNFV